MAAPSPAEPASYFANGHTSLALGDNRAQRSKFVFVEEKVATLGPRGWENQAFAQVIIEMGAGKTGGGAEIAGHVEPSEWRSIRRGRDYAFGQVALYATGRNVVGDLVIVDGARRG